MLVGCNNVKLLCSKTNNYPGLALRMHRTTPFPFQRTLLRAATTRRAHSGHEYNLKKKLTSVGGGLKMRRCKCCKNSTTTFVLNLRLRLDRFPTDDDDDIRRLRALVHAYIDSTSFCGLLWIDHPPMYVCPPFNVRKG